MIHYPKGFNYLIDINKESKLIFYINYIFACISIDSETWLVSNAWYKFILCIN